MPTQNVALYLLNHVTYTPAKFRVARLNGLGGDAFTRKVTDVQMNDGPTLVRNLNIPLFL